MFVCSDTGHSRKRTGDLQRRLDAGSNQIGQVLVGLAIVSPHSQSNQRHLNVLRHGGECVCGVEKVVCDTV